MALMPKTGLNVIMVVHCNANNQSKGFYHNSGDEDNLTYMPVLVLDNGCKSRAG